MVHYTDTKGFVLAAASSGVGKTTVASAICSVLAEKGHVVQPFKTGPDFVDPTYLTLAAGRTCRSLDGFPNPELMPFFYAEGCSAGGGLPAADIAVVEGVMGMYDGLGPDGLYSTAWLAKSLGLPVVLLVDAKAAATSVAAVVKGFASLEPLALKIAGVIANRVSGEGHAELIAEALDRFAGIPLIGWLPSIKDAFFPSRHLGLIPALERESTESTLERFTQAVREHVDLSRLVALAELPQGHFVKPDIPTVPLKRNGSRVKIAVAKDDAFCFHYYENWELLQKMGAEICFTSPLHDSSLPDRVDLLILPGGYPEEFADRLSANRTYIESVRGFSKTGAIYAECGGMLYLTKSMAYRGERYDMVGLIDADTVMTDKLQRFGYVEAVSLQDNLLFTKGQTFRAHEFHYSKVTGAEPGAFRVNRVSRRNNEWDDGYSVCAGRTLATYLHINFYTCGEAVGRMLSDITGF